MTLLRRMSRTPHPAWRLPTPFVAERDALYWKLRDAGATTAEADAQAAEAFPQIQGARPPRRNRED